MPEVSLLVTSRVLDHTGDTGEAETQIAVRSASPDISQTLQQITGQSRRELIIGGCVPLVMGDRGAIWRVHNGDRLQDFDELFSILARRPDQEFRVACEVR